MPQIAGRKVAQIVGPSRRGVTGRWFCRVHAGFNPHPSHRIFPTVDTIPLFCIWKLLPASDIQGNKITRTDDAYVHDVAFTRRVGT